jgi:hypothetical protein
MAGWIEAASGSLTLLAFWSALPRFGELGVIESRGGTIVVSPFPMTVPAGSPIGTVVGTISVQGGSGTYTFSLSFDQLGYFTIVGNQLQVNNAGMVAGTDAIVIRATGSTGDTIDFPTSVIITPAGYAPTYFLYGF